MLFEKIQLEPSEEILKTVRKHWFFILIELLGVLILLLFPLIILLLLNLSAGEILGDFSLSNFMAETSILIASWSLLVILGAFTVWTHYYLDLWIITDRRIIAVDQIGFFSRNVSIFRLERLQDIEFNISGLIPTLLNFGTIKAQTAGAHESNFKSTGLPDPRGLQALIQKATDARLATLNNSSSKVD